MFLKCLAIALALSLVLAQTRLAPPALAQAQPAGAMPQALAEKPAARTPTQNAAPLDGRAEKIRRAVQKIGLSQTVTVVIEGGDDLHGSVTYIGEHDFDISEVDQRRLVTVRYRDVKKVRSGYGGIAPLTGERVSHPRGLKIAAFAGLAALIALPLIILATAKE